mmetsp:Transcript_66134/g.213847  ORF Transcript_66134/g.213847 Transcript_66134/m.213847 type:complete len:128 (-) Transcript_66134:38-421(-)
MKPSGAPSSTWRSGQRTLEGSLGVRAALPRRVQGDQLAEVPAAHWVWISDPMNVAVALPYLMAMFVCYGFGACFYIAKWPERRWPGRFDLIGHSHQVWHVFVLLAALSWVHGSFAMLEHFSALTCSE